MNKTLGYKTQSKDSISILRGDQKDKNKDIIDQQRETANESSVSFNL